MRCMTYKSTNNQSSRDVWLPTRYNMEKQVYELKSKMRIRNICDDDWNKSGNSDRQTLIKNNRDRDFKVHHWQYFGEMEFYENIRNIRETLDVTRWTTKRRRDEHGEIT